MPEFMKSILGSLSAEQADELWRWLDEDADAVHQMIEVLCPLVEE